MSKVFADNMMNMEMVVDLFRPQLDYSQPSSL